MKELSLGLISKEDLNNKLISGSIVKIKNNKGNFLLIGEGCLIKVNTSLGVSSFDSIEKEIIKANEILKSSDIKPDLMMDLSIINDDTLLKHLLLKSEAPIGTLPHYRLDGKESIKSAGAKILKIAQKQAEAGVSFFTIHPTANIELARKAAKERLIPITSRGGGIILRSMHRNNSTHNIYTQILPEFARLCKHFDVAISIGSVFRPACGNDALDEVHKKEMELQFKYISFLKDFGCKVFFECLGHSNLSQTLEYSSIIKKLSTPMMALGPVVTDIASGFDHISNAIGSSFMAFSGGCHVINSITREEHTGGVPSMESIVEGIRVATISAHAVNISNFKNYKNITENKANVLRASKQSCVIDYGLFNEVPRENVNIGCSRCGIHCPLLLNNKFSQLT